jgi:hypothetical protein
MQREGVDITTNSAAQSNGASPPQPIAVAYFTRKPVTLPVNPWPLTNTYAEREASTFSRLRPL